MEQYLFKPSRKVPVSMQVSNYVRNSIETGDMKPGEKLLSITKFSSTYKVARVTVEKAYNILRKEGFITCSANTGFFVADSNPTRIWALLMVPDYDAVHLKLHHSLSKKLGSNAIVEMFSYSSDEHLLFEILNRHSDRYHHYYFSLPSDQVRVEPQTINKIMTATNHQAVIVTSVSTINDLYGSHEDVAGLPN